MLEVLILEANRSVSVDRLTNELWPEEPPKTSRNSIQRFVADIRSALGAERDRLRTTDAGYVLNVEPHELDVEVARSYRDQARDLHDRPVEASALLRLAIELFGATDDSEALTPTGRAAALDHQELRLQLIEERMDAELAAGVGPQLIDELAALSRRFPYRERLVQQLMTAMQSGGQRVAALRVYQQLRRRLVDDIGIEPSQALQDLERQILDEVGPPDSPQGQDQSEHLTTNAPSSQSYGLVGRSDDLEALGTALSNHRLVSLVGPGGVGRTSLAVAATAGDDSAVVVRLAEIRTGDELPDLVAAALGAVPEGNTPEVVTEEVVDVLRRASRLLVLDNAEHVIDAVAAFAQQVMQHSDSQLLITSREHLGVVAERVVRLGRLSMPSDTNELGSSESEQLFRLRAEAMGADLEGHGDTIATVCEVLEGLPLAIEIAATQMTYLGIRDLAERLDSMLDMTVQRASEDRHSSLTAVLQWSWDLLAEDESALIELLSVFQSRLSASVIDEIAGPSGMRQLAALVAKNLVSTITEDGRVKYSLPPSVRRFATARADERERLDEYRQAHADYLLAYLRQWSVPETNSCHDVIAEVAVHRLEYVPALEWLDDRQRYDQLIEMVVRVTGLWGRRGPGADLDAWSRRLLELQSVIDPDSETDSAILATALEARFRFGDYGHMAKYGERLVALEEASPTDLGTPLVGFYAAAIHTFTLDELSRSRAEAAFERAARTPSAELNLAQTQMWVGCCQLMNREFDEAFNSFTKVLERGTRPGGTVLWSELGRIVALHLLDRDDEAWAEFDWITSDSDESIWNYSTVIIRSVVRTARGDAETARTELAEAAERRMLERRAASRDDFQIGFGLIALLSGDTETARLLLANPMPQSPVVAALLLNYMHPEPMSPAEWQKTWAEDFEARLLSSIERFSGELASVEAELQRWWPERPPRSALSTTQ